MMSIMSLLQIVFRSPISYPYYVSILEKAKCCYSLVNTFNGKLKN